MGEPAEPSLEERAKRVALALLEVDCVRRDETSPFERELSKYRHLLHEAGRLLADWQKTQGQVDQQQDDLEMMVFGLAQECEMLWTEKRALQNELEHVSRLLAERSSVRP